MRLRTREQYRRMTQKASKFTGSWIVAEIRISQGPVSRLGITVTKKYGSAHERNRFKRLVREAFRLLSPLISFKFDIVVRPRSQALSADFQDVCQELDLFIKQIST